MKSFAFAVGLAGALAAFAAHSQTTLEVIPLKYRSADQVIPLIRPLLAGKAVPPYARIVVPAP